MFSRVAAFVGVSCACLSFWCLQPIFAGAAEASQVDAVHPRAHAHNDYEHERPLLDALEHGYCSVEADIHLVDGQLLVAHDPEDVRADRTLEGLYLRPLQRIVKENGGYVLHPEARFQLVIDFKTDGGPTYAALKPLLARYESMLARYSSRGVEPGAVHVVLSGSYPLDAVVGEARRLVAVDGRPHHLGEAYSSPLMPLVSANWFDHFSYIGLGDMPEDQKRRLHELAQNVHSEGKLLRFWATPHHERLWQELAAAGVDYIGSDDLAKLDAFLTEYGAQMNAAERH